jgi:hypothetical protein
LDVLLNGCDRALGEKGHRCLQPLAPASREEHGRERRGGSHDDSRGPGREDQRDREDCECGEGSRCDQTQQRRPSEESCRPYDRFRLVAHLRFRELCLVLEESAPVPTQVSDQIPKVVIGLLGHGIPFASRHDISVTAALPKEVGRYSG